MYFIKYYEFHLLVEKVVRLKPTSLTAYTGPADWRGVHIGLPQLMDYIAEYTLIYPAKH